LKRVQLNSKIGETASVDLYDNSGVLLLRKEQPITKEIRDLLKNREVFVLGKQKSMGSSEEKVISFPKDIYTKLVDSLWEIYHDAKPILPWQIKRTMFLVDTIVKELKSQKVHLGIGEGHLSIEGLKQNDYGTFVHSVNVALLAALVGMRLGYTEKGLKSLILGALLHDVGKNKVPKEILNKPGKLSDEEFTIVKQHPRDGVEMLKKTRLTNCVMAMVSQHHERWNGTGYPYGLSGNSIHKDAQIIAVTDVYEALTADRPYRKGLPHYHALEMIFALSGKDFNPQVVQAFRESLVVYPENAIVTLNTKEIGVIVSTPIEFPTRPLVRVLFNNGRFLNEDVYIDLMQDLTRFIESVEFKELE
jgi:putative nucleotidyltransferase with HDIG domain